MAWSSRNGNYWQAGVTLTKVSETDTTIKLKYTALFRSDYKISVMSSITWSMSMSGDYTWSSSSGGEAEGKYITSENDESVTLYTKEFTVDKTTSSQTITAKNTVEVTSVSSGTKSASVSYEIPAKTSYTVSYDANGGSGAPSSQKKWHGTALTLSSAKPTRTGYTFVRWVSSGRTDGTVYFQPSGTTNYNGNQKLVAEWEENRITVNLYSNYADYGTYQGESLNVSASTNVLVYTKEYLYDNTYSDGLNNVQNTEHLYLSRTGYTPTGYWGTSTSGGTLLNQTTSYTGQSLAEAVGKTLETGNATVNLYAQWSENVLTINYYSNYATSAFDGALNTVGSDKNVHVYTGKFYYDNDYSEYGLANYSGSGGAAYMTRSGYTATGNWTTSDGKSVHEDDKFSMGQNIAKAFGKDISKGNVSINVYAEWRANVLTIKYHVNGGKTNSSTYHVSNSLICSTSSSSVLEDKWNYNNTHTDGLYNASTFGLTREGYSFVGWKVGSSGTTVFDQDDTSIVPTNLASNLTTGDRTITLYAVWEISGVVYIDNGSTFEPYLTYIDNGTSWDLYIAYVDDGTNWNIIS